MRLLLVEDHVPLADELLAGLIRQGYAVDWLADGRDAAYQGATEPYDLIILDLGLPGKPGLEVLQEWRASGLSTPVLILTARGSWAERIEGLKAGADDYLSKPFPMAELVARVRALLRRPQHQVALEPVWGDVQLRPEQGLMVCGDGTCALPRTEMQIMLTLFKSEGAPVRRSALEAAAWGAQEAVTANALDVALHRLRRKLDSLGSHMSITNIRGVGYAVVES